LGRTLGPTSTHVIIMQSKFDYTDFSTLLTLVHAVINNELYSHINRKDGAKYTNLIHLLKLGHKLHVTSGAANASSKMGNEVSILAHIRRELETEKENNLP